MSDRITPSELEWEEALQKLYRRKNDERTGNSVGLREGDPRQFRAAAAELTAKAKGGDPDKPLTDRELHPIENPRLIIQCWDEILPSPLIEHEFNLLNPETLKAEAILGKAIWDILQKFGADEVYAFLKLVIQAADSASPFQMPFQVKASDFRESLFWQVNNEKQGNDNPIDPFVFVLDLIDRLCKLTVTLFQLNMEDKNVHQHRVNQINSPFWLLTGTNYISRLGRTSSKTSSSNRSEGYYRNAYVTDVEFTFIPGHWLSLFIQRNPNQLDSLIEFSRIAKDILRINPTRKKLASRLAIFLTAIEPLHQSGSYRVRDLLYQIDLDRLKPIEEQKSLEVLYRADESQTRLLLQWNNALRRLQQLDWMLEFDDETYPNSLRPTVGSENDGDDDNTVPGRFENWFSTWLDGRLILRSSPPEIRIENVRLGQRKIGSRLSLPKKSRTSAPTVPAPITGRTLDVALTLKGWSKAQLSYHLHMDRSMITHWIKGSRPISEDQRKKLWKILGKELVAAQKVKY